VLFAVALGLVSSATASAGTRPATVVARTQALVTLLAPHPAREAPAPRSRLLAIVPATAPITEGRTVLPVLGRRGRWLRVELPGRPNGHTGWISDASTTRSSTVWQLVVDPALRRVTVYRSGRLVRSFPAVVGKPGTPTPVGRFFVEESVALRPGDVGAPFALALSARSEVLQDFDGGPGQIALHGLDNVGGTLGTASSHGCIRLADAAMRWLVYHVGPGAPVTITG
jgi:hypothetical protein